MEIRFKNGSVIKAVGTTTNSTRGVSSRYIYWQDGEAMFNVLSLDQSTGAIGWAIFQNGELAKWGYLNLKQVNQGTDTLSHAERRQHFINFLGKVLKEEKIDYIVYEGIFNKQNIDTVVKLAKMQGSIEDASIKHKVAFEGIGVTTWRSHLPLRSHGAKRNEMKKAVCEYIEKLYPHLEDEAEDTKEAIAMGLGWIKMMNKQLKKGR